MTQKVRRLQSPQNARKLRKPAGRADRQVILIREFEPPFHIPLCTQQKTRCDSVDTASEAGFRCKRCAHFNIECSFENSPPRDSVAVPTEPPNAPSMPWVPSPEPSNPENRRQEPSKHSASTTWPTPYAGLAAPSSSYSRVPRSRGPSPSGHSPQSPGRSAKVGSVSGDSTSASLKTKVAAGYVKQSLRHPVAPPSPPRSADRTDNQVPYEALTTSPAWTPNCGRPTTNEVSVWGDEAPPQA
jgi:hypothetical protein